MDKESNVVAITVKFFNCKNLRLGDMFDCIVKSISHTHGYVESSVKDCGEYERIAFCVYEDYNHPYTEDIIPSLLRNCRMIKEQNLRLELSRRGNEIELRIKPKNMSVPYVPFSGGD